MAEVLGSFADREGADATQGFYAGLERVDAGAVRAVAALLAAQGSATVEVPPQKLSTP
jgi:hypothetical protein